MLVEVLTGKKSPLETLFPNGQFDRAEELYERAPLSAYFSSIARAALDAFVRCRKSKSLNVIEIGAGTGGTTSALLPSLPPDETTYCFTDLSEVFLARAERKFAAYPFMRYEQFDIEQSASEQGYSDNSFDVVVATNVLHATRNIGVTLQNVRSLLAPGGILILCDLTEYLSWYDVTTGLIDGWQVFEDELRQEQPLLTNASWKAELARCGFASVASFPAEGAKAEILGQHVFLAREPDSDGPPLAHPQVIQSAQRPKREHVDTVAPADRTYLEALTSSERTRDVS